MKKLYRAAPGVEAVNGIAVPKDRLVRLTDVEALFDLAHGRIVPEAAASPARREAPVAGAGRRKAGR